MMVRPCIEARLLAAAVWALVAGDPLGAADLRIAGAAVVDVASGKVVSDQTVDVVGERIAWRGPSGDAPPLGAAILHDARGHYLVPGLWDMHVHAHRDDRAASFYPLFVAHGVTGIREMGSHLAELLAARAAWRGDRDAPSVIWGSPVIDGVPTVLRHGLGVQSPGGARALVRLLSDLGFDFVKVYDRLAPDLYEAVLDEARSRGLPVAGHVPLASSPLVAARFGQRSIEHLTLVLEACVPGAVERANERAAYDSMDLLTDGWLAKRLHRFDSSRCDELFRSFQSNKVWQTPTLVQLHGFAHAREMAKAADFRLAYMRPSVREEWRAQATKVTPAVARSTREVLRYHHRIVAAMNGAGVGILAGTDASSEPWVYPGESLHRELELFVEAGLSPLDALRTATLNPLAYRNGRRREEPIRPGAEADLVLLSGNPLARVSATREVAAVVLRGRLLDRRALERLIEDAKAQAQEAPPER